MAHITDVFTSSNYEREQDILRNLLEEEIKSGKEHLIKFVDEWDRLMTLTGQT